MKFFSKKDAAVFYKEKRWKKLSHEQRAWLQLYQDHPCMPFHVFRTGIKKIVIDYCSRRVSILSREETNINVDVLGNEMYNGDCIPIMRGMRSCTVHLVVTSPPYNVGIDYGELVDDNLSDISYKIFTYKWILECVRLLVPGGRICINVGNTGRRPYRFLSDIISTACLDLGLLGRQEFIWYKGFAVAAGKTSWGSWMDCTNPITRDCHEYIESFNKPGTGDNPYRMDFDKDAFPPPDVTDTEFAYFSFSVWEFKPLHTKKHKATFPVELPRRCIKFYTRPTMTVLDPFLGLGSTLLACKRTNRKCIGIEINPEYVAEAARRTKFWQNRLF